MAIVESLVIVVVFEVVAGSSDRQCRQAVATGSGSRQWWQAVATGNEDRQ